MFFFGVARGVGTAARLAVVAPPVAGAEVAAAAVGGIPALAGGLVWASAQRAPSAVALAMTVANLAAMFFLNLTVASTTMITHRAGDSCFESNNDGSGWGIPHARCCTLPLNLNARRHSR